MGELFLKTEVIWFLAGFLLLGGELITSGFIIIFFGFGAWAVSILCFFYEPSLDIQLSVFLFVSVLLLVFLRKKVSNIFKGDKSDADSDDYQDDIKGETAIVSKDIIPGKGGKVSFRGSEWDADSDEEIKQGEPVLIIDRKSIKLIVKSNN